MNEKSLFVRLGRAIAGPIGFAIRSGYFKSCLRGFAVDAAGQAIPMYTYPCVQWLIANQDFFKDRTVLEFGSGQSTQWWANHAKSVAAVEYQQKFADLAAKRFLHVHNVSIIIGDDYKKMDGTFDVISIDGYPRIEAARFVLDKLSPDGLVIVDNSDVQSLQAICTILRDEGFHRIDFIGLSPGAYHEQCTSLFFRSPAFFSLNPTVHPISPISLKGHLT